MRPYRGALSPLALLLLWLLLPQLPVAAESEPAAHWQVATEGDGVSIVLEWSGPSAADDHPGPEAWPLVEMAGMRLPARLVALRPTGSPDPIPRIARLESEPWRGPLPDAQRIIPRTVEGVERPALADTVGPSLPTSPIVRLRTARIRGRPIIIFAVTPLFERDGEPHIATTLHAHLPGATRLEEPTSLLNEPAAVYPQGNQPAATGQSSAPAPNNPAASEWALKLVVAERGIQRLTGADLADAGADLEKIDPTNLQIHRDGEEIAVEVRATSGGRLTRSSELRFYAPAPGDRWNATDTYWLTKGSTAGLRMERRDTSPGTAPVRTTAIEYGTWNNPAQYDSTLPGPDGDHWFAADLRTGPNLPPAEVEVPLTATLPLAPGQVNVTISGTAYTSGTHQLELHMGDTSDGTSWRGTGDWQHHMEVQANRARATLTLVPGSAADGTLLDQLRWRRPVTLDFGGQGAWFSGVVGTYRYELSNLAAGPTLYEIDVPAQPEVLTLSTGSTVRFEDGPVPHDYILAGPGTLHSPTVRAHDPGDLATPRGASAIYIAPARFHDALAPLVAWRRKQGHSVQVVAVQAIYDHWSFGQVDPKAIRSFLRYARATWDPAPTTVTLVGDGTRDPLNYTGKDNPNVIPPYLAPVDPWMGETACETCYVQLDGDDPLEDALPDLALGRLPVKDIDELATLVQKILRYEQAQGGVGWRSRALFIADNSEGTGGTADGDGDYAAFADRIAAGQPQDIQIHRVYYDPSPAPGEGPWREPDPERAHEQTMAMLDRGHGIVTYVGHASQWQWAVTELSASPPHLLGLYDVDLLANEGRPSIVLGMTCLTGSFHQPATRGTSIDERLLLHPTGGAIGVWGSTGLGVMYGHDSLQEGFFDALWADVEQEVPLGELVLAGYLNLYTNGNCCQSTLRTFTLLGDPLTPARALPATRHYLPSVHQR